MVIRQKQIKVYKRIRKILFSVINFLFLNIVTLQVFKVVAKYGYGGNRCLRNGFLPLPVHFYSPVPDVDDLIERKVWDKKSLLSGIPFSVKPQLSLLNNIGKSYGNECKWPFDPTNNPADFYLDINGFSYGCAAVLYSMIRKVKPKRIIEIGSGNSSKIISQAIMANHAEGFKTNYTIIDPYPGNYVSKKLITFNKLIKSNVELCDPRIFDKLGSNDILFIDSSHVVKIGNDVNFLYLDILPRLKPGVIIHIHDISLPYEYSKIYTLNEENRQFWTEQYLLQAFLINNKEFKILLGMHYVMKNHLKNFQKAFPFYDRKIHKLTSGSFWIQKERNR